MLGVITNFGGPAAAAVGSILIVLVLVKKRQHWLALTCMMVVIGGAVLNEALKHIFLRQRPRFNPPVIPPHGGYSFPSGHSMGSLVFYGLLAYLLLLAIPNRLLRWTVVAALGLLVLAIGFSRIYLGGALADRCAGRFRRGNRLVVWLDCGH